LKITDLELKYYVPKQSAPSFGEDPKHGQGETECAFNNKHYRGIY